MGIDGQGLLVFVRGIFPAIAFQEHIAKEPMPPGGLRIETSAAIGETRCEIKVLMSNSEQSLSLVWVQLGNFAVLLSSALKILLGQVIERHCLMRISARWIEFQCLFKVRRSFVGRAKFDVIHPDDDVEVRQIWAFSKSMGQVTGSRVVVEEALIGKAKVDLRLEQARIQCEDLLEFHGCADKISLSESYLPRAKRDFDLLLC